MSALVPLTAAAQGNDLGTINVTAQRVAAPSELSSKVLTVISRKQIEASHADSVPELLRGRADIVVRDTSSAGLNGKKASIDLGGFGESSPANAVVLIDGRRVNNPDLSGVDWTQVPVDQIERIEIVHGGSSVLYGNGAVGGAINIITRIPKSGTKLSVRGGSFGTVAGSMRIGASSGHTRIEGNLSGDSTNGYRKNSPYERYDGGMRFEVDLPRGVMLYGSGNHHHDRYGLPGSLTAAQLAADRRQTLKPKDHGTTDDSYVNGGLLIPVGGGDLDLPLSFRRRATDATYISNLYGTTVVSSVLRTLSLRPKLDWHREEGWYRSIVAGVDINRVNGSLSSFKAKRRRTGYYLSSRVGDAEKRYVLSGGVRSEEIRDTLTKVGGSSISGRETAYDIGLVLRHNRFSLHLDHNRSFRFPLLDERYNYGNGTWNALLKPQTGRHDSAAVGYDAASFHAEASFRRANLHNEIYLNPVGGPYGFGANENYHGTTRHDVFMLHAEWRASSWLKLSGAYTHIRATFRDGIYAGHGIPAVPHNRFSMRWNADWIGGFRSGVAVRHIGSSWLISDQANARPKLSAYTVVDVRGSYRWHDLKVFMRINNLTNRKYSTYGVHSNSAGTDNFYPEAGINGIAGVSYSL